jgi:multidrug efflux pump subunit AcrA (membrane-fusion protein)
MAQQVDLSQLAAPRAAESRSRGGGRAWARWMTRGVLPVALLAAFLATLGYAFRETIWAAQPVEVIPVISMRAEIAQPEATLFQCAGWVEPRPTPVMVSALDEGVVEKLLVIEGQELKAGDVVAQLIEADAKLLLLQAESEMKSRQAELASSQAALAAAEIWLREPIELQTKIAEAEAMLARVDSEQARLPGQIAAARAKLAFAEQERDSRAQSGESVSKISVARAVSELEAAKAALAELAAQSAALAKEQDANGRRVAGLRRQLELKTEERRQRAEAQAAVQLAESKVTQAGIALDTAKLRLSRMTVRAPTAGKVLALVARPGSKVMGLAPAAGPDASTVITMYDPARLQIRADVRLEEVPAVFAGQVARIETPAVKGPLLGHVIAATSITDIQKNTLQVKVAVDDPPAVLKPDMLVQVAFLSPPGKADAHGQKQAPLRIVVPPEVIEREGDDAEVWIADRQHRIARRQIITLGGMTADGMQEVTAGLSAGDRIIVRGAEHLQSGDRVRIVEEETDQNRGAEHRGEHVKMKRL